jgi:DNA-binding transcriptional ArsR family regulator
MGVCDTWRDRGTDAPSRLADDQFYRALAATPRRRLLSVLLDGEERTVDELATVLAGWDATDSGGMATPEDHERVAVELVHAHLPLLDDAGLVAHDRDDDTVSLEGVEPAVDDLIRRSVEAERSARA